MKVVEVANAEINERLASVELGEITSDAELQGYARSAGEAVFNTWCVQCHGREGGGFVGYPTLSDDDWLWGGTMEDIHLTISHGIRNEEDPDARYSEMPAFGRDELLSVDEIDQAVNYVMSLSGEPQDASKVEAGALVYADNKIYVTTENGRWAIVQPTEDGFEVLSKGRIRGLRFIGKVKGRWMNRFKG